MFQILKIFHLKIYYMKISNMKKNQSTVCNFILIKLTQVICFIGRLVDTFPEFLEQEQMDVPGLGTKFRSSMPKSIMLSHVVDVWKKIVTYEAQVADK